MTTSEDDDIAANFNKPKKIHYIKTASLRRALSANMKAVLEAAEKKSWLLYVVDQRRGFCSFRRKLVTVPYWVFTHKDPEYWLYYTAHELAHVVVGPAHSHDFAFMTEFKKLCPVHLWHYETEYKPQNAVAAGISANKELNMQLNKPQKQPLPSVLSAAILSHAAQQQALTKEVIGQAKMQLTAKEWLRALHAKKTAPPETEWHDTIEEAAKAVGMTDDDLSASEDSIPDELPDATEDSNAIVENYETDTEDTNKPAESFALNIVLNEKQLHAKRLAMQGKSFALIGPAGTGKTTTQRSVAGALLESDVLSTCSYKGPPGSGIRFDGPSFVACAFTRRAAGNLRKAIFKDPHLAEVLQYNIMTIHQLLEYEPEYYFDPIEKKDRFRFTPRRTAMNPLTITHLVIEESSMVGLDLGEKLYAALPTGVQIIFIGDINQLPPVFGPSLLNYALMQLPIVELTEVYRNQGVVLENAHRILKGEFPVEGTFEDGTFTRIVRGKAGVALSQSNLAHALAHSFFPKLYESGDYNPERDMILSPQNVSELGSIRLNNCIAEIIGKKHEFFVHEVIAGFNKLYLAEGDKVMYNKRDGKITRIVRNHSYYGKEPQPPGTDLSRFGVRRIGEGNKKDEDIEGNDDAHFELDYTNFNVDDLAEEKAERKVQASHRITIQYEDETEDELSSAGDFAPSVFSLGYVLTVHKAQGSEWDRTFIVLHKDMNVMLYRELLYTAFTRARTGVTLIAQDNAIEKALRVQRIKGSSLQAKLDFFNHDMKKAGTAQFNVIK
jgi:hypothetical protein